MKKIYFLFLLCSLSIAAIAQSTIQVYPVGGAGSYVTGNSDGVSRNDDNIVSSTAPAQSGYAVFDLSVIPPGVTIETVTINFNVATYGGIGTPSGWNTFGYVGDLSTVTVPATLFSDMMTGGTSISSASYGTTTGNQVIPSSGLITNFVATNRSGVVSISFTGGGTRVYTITGETGAATIAGVHKPYLNVTYCPVPVGVIPTAAPNPVCEGINLALNTSATVTSGLLNYAWNGPGGFTSLIKNPVFPAALTSAGVYTVTVTNVCGVFTATATATTPPVVVNPSPAPITGANAVCTTTKTTLSDATGGGGTWSSSIIGRASVIPTTGVVSGVSAGAVTISYILPVTGCYATWPMTVNSPPGAITGPKSLCQNTMITLVEGGVGVGAWSSSSTLTASVDGIGNVTAGNTLSGPVTIDFTILGCPPATYAIVVNPIPGMIGGGPNVCIGSPTFLTDALPGGTWTSTNTTAIITSGGFGSTKLTGLVLGVDTIIYKITATGCADSAVMNIVTGPAGITGPSVVCEGASIMLIDATGSGTWSSQDGTFAVVPVPTIGNVTGVSKGTVLISYILGTGCYATRKITVNPVPPPITAATTTICSNDSVLLSDTDPAATWSSSDTTKATVSSTGMVKGVAAPSVNILYTYPATGCYDSLILAINAAPSVIIAASGPTTFCTGGSVTLTVPTGGGGTTYQWYDGGIIIPGANTSSYTTSTTQNLTVQVLNSAGCIATSAPLLVISGISPSLDSNGSPHFCAGSNVLLTAKTNGAVGVITYQWERNGVPIISANDSNYAAGLTGIYNCLVTVSGGGSGSCAANTQSIDVTASPLPTPVVTFIKTTAGTQFTANNGYHGYQWYLNTKSIPGATNKTYTALINGSYRVLVTDSSGCTAYSTEFVINNVGVNELSKADVKIYPNPANAIVHIESPVSVHAVITSIEGKTLIDETNATDINISRLANGLYIIMLYSENGERLMLEKLIKE